MIINRERLAHHFTTLCEIDSPSRYEEKVAMYLQETFAKLDADDVIIDESATDTGSNTGNLVVRFNGNGNWQESLFFGCHMDTVQPAKGIQVARSGDIFTSKGDTVLGADDKSGIAPLIELIHLLREHNADHCPIELVFTTCEEIGLLGAKAFDRKLLRSKYGYALDSTRNGKVIIGAPAANKLAITITGKAAHSGLAPETGINALAIAAEAITRIRLGRIDDISTANFGLIQGGTARNIIPDQIIIAGEVRSHSTQMLDKYTANIEHIFHKVVQHWPNCDQLHDTPKVSIEIDRDFPAMALSEEEPVLIRIKDVATKLGKEMSFDIAGGGSDANIFCGYGLRTAILPTGMTNVHTTEEQVDLKDMVNLTEVLLGLVAAS